MSEKTTISHHKIVSNVNVINSLFFLPDHVRGEGEPPPNTLKKLYEIIIKTLSGNYEYVSSYIPLRASLIIFFVGKMI